MASFADDCAFSQSAGVDRSCVALYESFLNLDVWHIGDIETDLARQKSGIDRILTRADGREVYVEEKIRRTNFDDFLCEVWSQWYGVDDSRNVVGWTLDDRKESDLCVYAIEPLHKAYVLPFDLLRRTARTHVDRWARVHGAWPKDAENCNYTTRNCSVSWDRLFRDMGQTFRVCPFGGMPIQQSKPIRVRRPLPAGPSYCPM